MNLFSDHPRQRSYSAPKKLRTTPQPVHTVIKPEEDSSEDSETELSEEEYEGDEESETGEEDDRADSEHHIKQISEEDPREEEAPLEASSEGDRYRWHTVSVNGRDKILDLKLLEPYMKVISHGGTHMLNTTCLTIMSVDVKIISCGE